MITHAYVYTGEVIETIIAPGVTRIERGERMRLSLDTVAPPQESPKSGRRSGDHIERVDHPCTIEGDTLSYTTQQNKTCVVAVRSNGRTATGVTRAYNPRTQSSHYEIRYTCDCGKPGKQQVTTWRAGREACGACVLGRARRDEHERVIGAKSPRQVLPFWK